MSVVVVSEFLPATWGRRAENRFPKHFAAGDYNLYRYCHNDLVNRTDALGSFDVGFEGFGTFTLSTGPTRGTVGNVALRNYVLSRGGQVFNRTQAGQNEAMKTIQQVLAKNPGEPINITGYSRGAEAGNSLASKLEKQGIIVEHLTLIDPVSRTRGPQHLTVPDNVKSADNYYQRNGGPFSGGSITDPSDNRRNHDLTSDSVDHYCRRASLRTSVIEGMVEVSFVFVANVRNLTFMTRLVAVLFLLTLSCSAGENRHFFGEWTPPKSLQEFWAPIDESWWNKGYTPKLDQRCRDFAKRSKPAKLVPDIIEDLRASPSEVRWFVYLNVMRFWKKNDVLKALSPFQKSSDANVRHIANEFVADLE